MTQVLPCARSRPADLAARCSAVALVLLGTAGVTGRAHAQQYDWGVRAGATYSDNIARTATNTQAEAVVEGGIKLAIVEKRRWIDASIGSDIQYQSYVHHSFQSGVLGGVNGNIRFDIIPGRVSWTVLDNFGQTSVDPLAVETPANRQNTNFLTTGPDITIPFGTRTDFRVRGRWSEASYARTLANYTQTLGSVALIRHIAATSSVSLNVSSQRVTYATDAVSPSYDQQEAYAALDSTRERTTIGLQLGTTRLTELGHSTSGLLARLNLSRMLSPRAQVSLTAGVQFANSAEAFRTTQSVGGIVLGNTNGVVSTDPFRSEYGSLKWTMTSVAVTATVEGDLNRERHQTQALFDRNQIGGRLSIGRRISPQLTLGAEGGYGRQEFKNAGATLKDWSFNALLTWRLSTLLSLQARAGRFQGDGHGSIAQPINNVTRDFVENRATITLFYGRIH